MKKLFFLFAVVWITVAGSIIVSLLSLIGFFVFARSLGSALRRMTETMTSLATGDLSANVTGQDRSDEIGAMARAVQVFKDAANENVRLERETAEARAAQENQREQYSKTADSSTVPKKV